MEEHVKNTRYSWGLSPISKAKYMENDVHPVVCLLMNLSSGNLENYQVILSICGELI